MDNRPTGRKRKITGIGKEIGKTGSGLGTGPVGTGGQNGRKTAGDGYTPVRSGKGGGLISIIAVVMLLLGLGGGGLSGLFGGQTALPQEDDVIETVISTPTPVVKPTPEPIPTEEVQHISQMADIESLLFGNSGAVSQGWDVEDTSETLDTSVAKEARSKRTKILGNGKDTVTIMVYMCGADLESKGGMATSDLKEMASADISDNVNLLVYTGGARRWNNNIVSSSNNQVYKVERGGLTRLVENAGKKNMTDPATLTEFIKFCTKNYKANRNILIFWDHGGGSVSGYGYDERFPSSSSMQLKGIDQALKDAGAVFDFIGFDTCLMGSLENALTVSPYADYLVASEETEPGVGWYYKRWLTQLSKNTSMPTTQIGKLIIDDFVDVCQQQCRGQKATLSIIDLAELENTVPDKFREFARSTSELIENDNYKAVSNARSATREFAPSTKIDQVDLVHLAYNLGTKESKELAEALLGAIKYNRTSTDITNAYGISIYFPYRRTSKVDSAVAAFEAIGVDSEYTKCIQQFASLELGGQNAAGGYYSPFSVLSGGSSQSSSYVGDDMISTMLETLLGGSSGSGFFGRNLSTDDMTGYLTDNRFDSSQLVWTRKGESHVISLSEDQWSMVQDLELNVFYDDGEGYIDLGLDNVFEFTEEGELLNEHGGAWVAINMQPVPYYHLSTVYEGDDYVITGRVPVLYNGDRADLIVIFDSREEEGYVAGVRYDYKNGETETVGKDLMDFKKGDVIQFVCDYYSYDGTYQDSYIMKNSIVYDGSLTVSDVGIDVSRISATYCFTDIYCQKYWTPVMPS